MKLAGFLMLSGFLIASARAETFWINLGGLGILVLGTLRAGHFR